VASIIGQVGTGRWANGANGANGAGGADGAGGDGGADGAGGADGGLRDGPQRFGIVPNAPLWELGAARVAALDCGGGAGAGGAAAGGKTWPVAEIAILGSAPGAASWARLAFLVRIRVRSR
jgi:hypothetical protein